MLNFKLICLNMQKQVTKMLKLCKGSITVRRRMLDGHDIFHIDLL